MENKNYAIVLTRVISMFLIVLCHIIGYYKFIPGSDFLGQVFNVGVYTFFIISGFLYGKKEILEFKKWIRKRWCKIVIPIILVTLINMILLTCIGENVNPLSLFYYTLNIQGLSFISDKLSLIQGLSISNLSPLWFTTIIMLCYCLIPLIQKVHKHFKTKSKYYECGTILFLFVLNFILTALIDITLIYFIVFYFGYVISACGIYEKETSKKKYILQTIIMFLLQLIRILIKSKMDESSFYVAVTGISHFSLGFWIFTTIFKIKDMFPKNVKNISELKVIKWLDMNSYYIFLTHGLFCMGKSLNVFIKFDNILTSSVLFIILTLGTTYILAEISEKIMNIGKYKT